MAINGAEKVTVSKTGIADRIVRRDQLPGFLRSGFSEGATAPTIPPPDPTEVGTDQRGEQAGTGINRIIAGESELDKARARMQEGFTQDAPDLATVQERERVRAQSMIDATESLFQEELSRIRKVGAENLAETSSIAVGAGLAGSPFKTQIEAPVKTATQSALTAESRRREAEITAILVGGDDKAQKLFESERESFLAGAREQISQLEAQQIASRDTLVNIAKGGFSLDEIPADQFQSLLENSGLSELEARALHGLNSPDAQVSYEIKNGKLIGIFIDPKTGKAKITTQDIPGLEAAEEVNIQEFDGVPYVIGKDADGNVVGQILPGFQQQLKGDDQFTLSEGQSRFDSQGNLIAEGAIGERNVQILGNKETGFFERNPTTGEWNQVIDAFVNPTDTAAVQKATEKKLADARQNTVRLNTLQVQADRLTKIFDDPAIKGVVGVYPIGRITPIKVDKAERINFFAGIQQVIAAETLNTLIELKKQGGTLGALSETELDILKSSATKINDWIIKDEKTKEPTGKLRISEKLFLEEIQILRDSTKRMMDGIVGESIPDEPSAGQIPEQDLNDFMEEKGVDRATAEASLRQAQEAGTYTPDFSSDLSRSENGSGKIVTTKIGGRTVKVSDKISNKLARADAAFFKATGNHLKINEGFRSRARQKVLYDKFKAGTGGRAAPPGQSFHQSGNAVDVANWKAAEKFLRAEGFKNDLADDRNHFSIGEFA